MVNFCFDFLQELLMVWEATLNIRKDVSSDIQTPWSWLKKKTRLRLVFSTISRCLDIFLMFDILHEMLNINKEERRNFLSTYFAENPNLGKPEIRYVIFWLEVTNIDQMGKKKQIEKTRHLEKHLKTDCRAEYQIMTRNVGLLKLILH